MADQLQRAGMSVPLGIAEGALPSYGEAFGYGVCGDLARLPAFNLIEDAPYRTGRELPLRILAMLVQMVRRTGETGSGTGAGTK